MFRKKNFSWRGIKFLTLISFVVLATFSFFNFNNLNKNYLSGGCKNFEKLGYLERELCWYEQIKKEIVKGGVKRSLGLIKRLHVNVPEFAGGCHDVMHLVGTEVYKEYLRGTKNVFGEETTYCGYGFYHGFIETMLYTKGDYSEVREFCESVNFNLDSDIVSPNAIYSCYHGMGHSAFEIHDPTLWGNDKKMVDLAIESCVKLTSGLSDEKVKQCVTGVFNALGIAYSNNQYKLEMKREDPAWICRIQPSSYKRSCYMEVTMAWIYKEMGSYDYDFVKASRFIESLNDIEAEKFSMFGLASDYTRLKIDNFSVSGAVNMCRNIKNDLFMSCIEGVSWGLLGWGEPGEEYKAAILLCETSQLSSQESQGCFSYFLPLLNTMYSKKEVDQICSTLIPNYYIKYCSL